jgi:hypothetical protein
MHVRAIQLDSCSYLIMLASWIAASAAMLAWLRDPAGLCLTARASSMVALARRLSSAPPVI